MIKHIVISGGDLTFLSMLGALITLANEKFIDLSKIENFYCVSCGCWIGLFMQLGIELSIIKKYFIERPWEKLLTIDSTSIFNLYSSLGLFDITVFYEIFKPLLKMCNLNVNITMKELYEYSKKEFNIYATKFSDLSLFCFNHINTPDIKVLDALFMSSTIPILLIPIKYKNNYYIDGGYNCNYPIIKCLEKHKDLSEIFGINTLWDNNSIEESNDENFFSFYSKIIYKLVIHKRLPYSSEVSINTINIPSEFITIDRFSNIVNNMDDRIAIIKKGEDVAKKFIS